MKNNIYDPWIGKDFKNQKIKTLIVGDSIYNWADKEKLKNPKYIADELINWFIKNNNKQFERNLVKTFIGNKNDKDKIERFWNSIAFTEYLNQIMDNANSKRNYNDYFQNSENLISTIKELMPDYVIILGFGTKHDKMSAIKKKLGVKKSVNYEKISGSIPESFDVNIGKKSIKFINIRHTSQGYSWNKWNEFLSTNFPELVKNYS